MHYFVMHFGLFQVFFFPYLPLFKEDVGLCISYRLNIFSRNSFQFVKIFGPISKIRIRHILANPGFRFDTSMRGPTFILSLPDLIHYSILTAKNNIFHFFIFLKSHEVGVFTRIPIGKWNWLVILPNGWKDCLWKQYLTCSLHTSHLF